MEKPLGHGGTETGSMKKEKRGVELMSRRVKDLPASQVEEQVHGLQPCAALRISSDSSSGSKLLTHAWLPPSSRESL